MIRTNHLEKRFGSVGALRGVSLTVEEGSATALIGANGAGKSTLIRILMNLYEPARGSATVLGVDSRRLSPRELAQIGYVAESQEIPPQFTVAGYLDYLRPFYPTWDRGLEASLLARFRLPGNRAIGELSHGMRMKMGLLCALPFHPKLLILDEPLNGLDPMTRDDLIEGMLSNVEGVTILISSQEISEIESLITQPGEYSWCKPDYDPLKWHLARTNQPPEWAELYPGWVSPHMHLVLRIYEAENHFTRRVTIPSFSIDLDRPWL